MAKRPRRPGGPSRPSLIRTAKPFMFPPPVGGWNTRDPVSAMELTDAPVLDNWIPDVGAVRYRKGSTLQATLSGSPGGVGSIMEYSPPSGGSARDSFIAANTAIYSIEDGSSVHGSLNAGTFQHVNFGTSAGSYLYVVSGTNAPRTFDGSAWATASVTGATATAFDNVWTHGQRLWFTKTGSLDAYYLGTQSIAGAATAFPLGSFARKGGHLVAGASWTQDGGDGIDDLWVAITSMGETFVYRGHDPNSADTFALVGVFALPPPLGRRCLVKLGGDLAVLTKFGVISLRQSLPLPLSGQANAAVTDKINTTFRDAAISYGANSGWEMIEHPKRGLLIVNIPIGTGQGGDGTIHQYVMSTKTGAWCRFTGINALCWGHWFDDIYWGSADGKVYKWDGGYADITASSITATYLSAFSNCGTPYCKIFGEAEASFLGQGTATPAIGMNVNFNTSATNLPSTTLTGTAGSVLLGRHAIGGEGIVGALGFKVIATEDLSYNGTNVLFQPGAR